MTNDIYADIARRTDGDIYIGVVGPVRTGKSSLIKRFMESLVIPNIESDYRRERAVDELPQSAAGKTIMTTEPKFIPEEAVEISVEDAAKFRVRMIDCVGYIIPSAIGYFENNAPRMVMTPWFDSEIPFNMAAEVGTQKVITEHSTIGLVVTTDGSITDLPREEYEECEERVINELKQINKPFVVLLNCVKPKTQTARDLSASLSDKYGTTVIPVNCLELDEDDIRDILTQVLYAFPVKEINIEMPNWINTLDKGHWLKDDVFQSIKNAACGVANLREVKGFAECIKASDNITDTGVKVIDLGTGSATISVTLKADLFFKIVGEATGLEIKDESDLMPQILSLVKVNQRYSKIADALKDVEETGYGIVMPSMDELTLDEPEIIKQGGKYGIRLRATAPSIHMMKADITTEVSPIVGSEKQSEELVLYMLNDFEEAPEKIWESNIFGKSLHELVNEGLQTKLMKMPADARAKLQEAIERIINEGCAGLICFIL
ncbi:MAG: stage IV sporulation protein A [Oscillospiraceae bacterium]